MLYEMKKIEKRLEQAEELLKICIPQLPDETAKELQEFLCGEENK